MPDKFAQFIPFMAAAAAEGGPWRIQRIIEALIIAGIAGAISVYGTQKYMDGKLMMMEKQMHMQMNELKSEIRQIRNDFYVPRFRSTQ